MQKAVAGRRRIVASPRPAESVSSTPATRLRRRSVGLGRLIGERVAALAATTRRAARPRRSEVGRRLRAALAAPFGSERVLPITVGAIVLFASFVSFRPGTASGATGADGDRVRIAVGGGAGSGIVDGAPYDEVELGNLVGRNGQAEGGSAGVAAATSGPVTEDGTVYKPVNVDTTVADGRDLLRKYTVQSGDTLTGIASRYGISMMTIWWANKLTSKDDLHIGQKLIIPPVNGLVVTVKEGDTLEGLAAKHGIDGPSIVATNQLEDTNLVVGQVLVLPDARGAPIPTPKPRPICTSCGGGGGGGSTYTGGRFGWPVVGGNNYISQYYHYGHYAIDIAATYGSKVVSAAGGTVVFAGWKGNGDGYQVWVSHGGNLYTGYYHMSSITVGYGQAVSRGTQLGRVGTSGWATGPHLHFEVWVGMVAQGYRVNPLRYY